MIAILTVEQYVDLCAPFIVFTVGILLIGVVVAVAEWEQRRKGHRK